LSSAEVALTIISTVIGALLGIATSHYYFRRSLAAGPQLVVGLEEKARIDRSTAGTEIRMKVGRIEVTNLVVLEITVSNPGTGNLVVNDADDEERQPNRPRIELPIGLQALADPWNPAWNPHQEDVRPNPRADVRMARQLRESDDRQVLHIHVRGLAVGETTRWTVLCTYRRVAEQAPLTATDLQFFPGMDERFTAQGDGLLKDAPVLTG